MGFYFHNFKTFVFRYTEVSICNIVIFQHH